ncbi:protein winged eye isoform X1 [Plutella xylostella]|uniref:protein winged eye isoform X1 n=1 Tax=Plutella xylostella TaxID=51655 RepID=UPI00203271E5|nr:protein winged eye isoform X1 [Plutella xylostella]XP_048482917.1 protein winged eye isoform X1 [Plutella xylostella]
MLGGAAGARSRPPNDQPGHARFPVYSLFPQQGNRSTIHKVTESLYSTSLSAFGVPTPPPHSPYSPLHLELLNTCQRVTFENTEKDQKMEDGKLGMQCVTEASCCPTELQRQMLENVTSGMQPLAVKTEHARRTCCLTGSPKKLMQGSDGGCSRTNPVTWVGLAGQNLQVQVKREPQHMHMSELVAVKLEQASPGNKPDHHPPTIPASLNNGSIPVGIAVARQRVGDAGLLAALSHKDNQHRMHDIGPASFCCHFTDAAQAAMTVGVANVLCDDRPAPMAWPAPPQPAPSASLWQYPTAQVAMESMMVGGVGVGGVNSLGGGVSSMGGFQLVRDPASGALLLLPTPPDLPHTVVWGGVPYPSAPLILPPAPHPSHHLQLLPGDILASTATLQHTHTHSTRLVTLAPAPPPQQHPSHADKRKPMIQPLITPHTLIKIEQEPPQEKQQTFMPEPVQQPMLAATHLYYQPEFSEQACRSQATSPAAPPTPPPEAHESPAHKDASNQTDHIDDDDDESPNHADEHERVACVGVAHYPEDSHMQTLHPSSIDSAEDSSSEGLATSAVVGAVEKAIDAIERDEALDNSSSGASNDLVIDTGRNSPVSQTSNSRHQVDVSGLELLSNSIEQFERTTPGTCMPSLEPVQLTVDTRTTTKVMIKCSPKSPPPTADAEPVRRFEFPPPEGMSENAKPSLDGLGLLCALAEQRFMEEVVESPSINAPSSSRPFIKSEPLLSPIDRHRPTPELETVKDRHRDDSSSERRRKRSRDREDRLRHKLEKMRRHKREREEERNGGELEASLRRVTTCPCGTANCSHVSAAPAVSAQDLVKAMEKDMRERLQDLQRQCDEKRAQLNALTPPLPPLSTPSGPSTPAPSPDSDRGSSKKRKVGRPRKVSSPDSSTETIVAKKPKSKSSLVGYLLAKGKLKGGIVCSKSDFPREEINRTSKVRPKLKAEPILKLHSEEEEHEFALNKSTSSSMESLNEVRQKNREKVDKLVRKHSRDGLPELEFALRRGSASSDSEKERRRAKKRRKSVKSKERTSEDTKESLAIQAPQQVSRCTLTEELIDTAPRVLTAMGGLFYAGKLSAVTAPDVYAITLDGERGNKPHILSREETLRDAILEVSPNSVAELASGTRVCAYWSQQYRCLYPGTVAETSSPDPHDDKFVAVEFDDGDSGRIAIEDIRLLEPNYPVVEYQNPLFTLGKRRRNTSVNSVEDKKPALVTSAETAKPGPSSEMAPNATELEDRHRERKKLKKLRKEKLKRKLSSEDDPSSLDYVKKKKKKHKCCEDHCKHRRHHKKHHRKHRKRHHSSCKEQSSSSGDDHQKKSSSEYADSNKEGSVDSNERLSTLVAMEKSPDDKMKTVIKKAVLTKSCFVKTAVLDVSKLGRTSVKKESKDNLKDSGIGLEEENPSTSDVIKKKVKRRTVSSTSSDGGMTGGVSKMAAFLPGGALWRWCGPVYRRTAKPRLKKLFYKAIQRGEEVINVGDAAVFLSTGRPDRPYIGRIVALWEARGAMAVRVKWFYHPEETIGLPDQLNYPGGLFESPHTDENDVQTISHRCEVLPLAQYKDRMGDDPVKYSNVYDNNDVYYLAGNYDPTQQTLKMEPDIPFAAKSSS